MKYLLFLLFQLVGLCAYYLWQAPPLPEDVVIDKLVVKKSERKLEVWSADQMIKSYKIALGSNPIGKKTREGDGKTPEGSYTIHDKNPHSAYHLNLGISYPNSADKEVASKMGLSPGGHIKIHGLKNGIGWLGKFRRFLDWTNGCVAVTNSEMEELYSRVEIGTPILIMP